MPGERLQNVENGFMAMHLLLSDYFRCNKKSLIKGERMHSVAKFHRGHRLIHIEIANPQDSLVIGEWVSLVTSIPESVG